METIGSKLVALRKKMGLNQQSVAKELGITQTSLSHYELDKRRPDPKMLLRLAAFYSISVDWLLSDLAAPPPTRRHHNPVQPVAGSADLTLPVIPDIAAGAPIDVSAAEPLESVTFCRSLLTLPGPYYAFRVSGDSMTPEIRPGDLVVIAAGYPDIDLQSHICAFRTPDGILLKRLLYDDKSRSGWLVSINAHDHPPLRYDRHDNGLVLLGVLNLLIRKYQ